MTYKKVCDLDQLWMQEMKSIQFEGKQILLLNIDNNIFAYEDRCSHLGVRLSEGRLNGCTLTCRAHEWQFDAQTGQGQEPKGTSLRSYTVKIEGNDILIDMTQTPALDVELVGPVLQTGNITDAVVTVMKALNPLLEIQNRGSYLRAMAPHKCHLTAAGVEGVLGQPFNLPGDLEAIMPSFKGKIAFVNQEVFWTSYSEDKK